jgi:hypothetical protein
MKHSTLEKAKRAGEGKQKTSAPSRKMEIGETNRSQKAQAMEKTLQTTDTQPIPMTRNVSAKPKKQISQDVPRNSSEVARGHEKNNCKPCS